VRSLRIKFLFSHLALVLLMAALTGASIWSFVIIGNTVGRSKQSAANAVRGAQLIQASLLEQRTSLYLLLAHDPRQANATYQTSWKSFRQGVSYAQSVPDETATALINQVIKEAVSYRAISDQLIQNNQVRVQPIAVHVIQDVLEPKLIEMRKTTAGLMETAQQDSMSDSLQARKDADAAITRSLFATLAAICLAIMLGMLLVRTAVTPLDKLAKRAEAISGGDLAPKPIVPRQDEIGALNIAFEEMAARLAEAQEISQRRLQRLEQMSDAAFEHLYDPVIVLDQKARIVHQNQAADQLFGPLEPGEKVSVKEHISDRRLAKALYLAAMSQEVTAAEDETALTSIAVDGLHKTFRLRATPMKDGAGHPLGSVAVLEDVTHLRELDRLKNEFIGVASHELRTPVSSLLLSAELLKDGAVGPLTQGQQEVVAMQLEDLTRLEKLMKDLLDVTKLEAGSSPPKTEKVPVLELMRSPVETLRGQANKKNVALQLKEDESLGKINADRTQIGRVLTNLIANAIRHTPSGGQVNVYASGQADEVTFYVADSGEGIPPEYIARIFDRFVQVPGATQGGAGLGLSIANNIVRAHHGRMAVESKVGQGSVFSFTLPRDFRALAEENVA
jgi:NtrC-family two-component system sensor histidine kinase KinB